MAKVSRQLELLRRLFPRHSGQVLAQHGSHTHLSQHFVLGALQNIVRHVDQDGVQPMDEQIGRYPDADHPCAYHADGTECHVERTLAIL